jgi:hypothetical protein
VTIFEENFYKLYPVIFQMDPVDSDTKSPSSDIRSGDASYTDTMNRYLLLKEIFAQKSAKPKTDVRLPTDDSDRDKCSPRVLLSDGTSDMDFSLELGS